MRELGIDIETYSETDIKAGVHKYCEDPKFDVTLLGYSIDNEEPVVLDLLSGDKIPPFIYEAILSSQVLKTAYNAAFEIACLSKYFGLPLDPKQWSCTQALAAQAGLPFGLDNVAKALGSGQQKDAKGKELIKYFTMPCKPSKANGMRTRNYPQHDFFRWLDFKYYCGQDVRTEQDIRRNVLSWFEVSAFEKPVWFLDQKINNVGVCVDKKLIVNAIAMEAVVADELTEEMIKLTGIKNPKSAKQVKDYIMSSTGLEITSLNKASMPDVMKQVDNKETEHVLKIREQLSRSSIKKFTAMEGSAGAGDRIRGLFMYYGANRTGRFAGRNVQVHNLKRNDLKDLDFARQLVRAGKLDVLKLTYGDVGLVLSNLIRTAFIPSPGNRLGISDLSAIEARIVAWLADETWRLEVFKTHGKIYEASASQMFKIPMDQVTKEIRFKGKISELALGYQGAAGALERMGALTMGLKLEELPGLVKLWRKANPKIVRLWYALQEAAVECIVDNAMIQLPHGIRFSMRNRNMIITLPSGRDLVYLNAKYVAGRILYMGMDQTTKQWCMQDTYGGKLLENVTQAIARDVLVVGMQRIDAAGHEIVMHVHDEVVVDTPDDVADELTQLMSAPISWAAGLPLGAESFMADYYQK